MPVPGPDPGQLLPVLTDQLIAGYSLQLQFVRRAISLAWVSAKLHPKQPKYNCPVSPVRPKITTIRPSFNRMLSHIQTSDVRVIILNISLNSIKY